MLESRPIDATLYEGLLESAIARTEARSARFSQRFYHGEALREMPEEYRAGSPSSDWSTQALILPIAARWFEPDSSQPVTFFVNQDGAAGPEAIEDVSASIQAWASVPATSIQLVNGGPKTVCNGVNGIGVIVFNNCDNRFQPSEDCSRFLARGGMVWDNRITKQVGGQTYRKTLRGFVSINPFQGCS